MSKPSCSLVFDIPFHDVDMLEVVWHGHYYKYFELGRTALFRKYDFDVARMRDIGYYMVVTDSRCRYIRPIKYGTKIRIKALLDEWEYLLKIRYELADEASGETLAKGMTTHASIDAQSGETRMITPQIVLDHFFPNAEPVNPPQVKESASS